MQVVFRVDASVQSGSGHVMRCLTLADELEKVGVRVHFVSRRHRGHAINVIAARGFIVHELASPPDEVSGLNWNYHASWLGVPWRQDAEETLAVLDEQNIRPDWLIVDHYALGSDWQRLLRPRVGQIMVIDDLADRPHDCDLLLDQNFYADMETRYSGLVPEGCKLLLGPEFALLRPEFGVARKTLLPRSGKVKRLHLFMGGSDPDNVTGNVLDALEQLERDDIVVDLVVGGQAPARDALKSRCRRLEWVAWHENVADMAALMVRADLAVGAGGTAVWERACLGLPSMVLSIAENQVAVAEAVAERGCCLYLGSADEVGPAEITGALATLLRASSLLRQFDRASRALTDGRGVARVARRLSPPDIIIREALAADCEALFCWRNDPKVRAFFFDPEPLSLEDHRQWMARVLDDPDRVLLIGEECGEAVGVVRYDLAGSTSTVSVYLVPEQFGRGVGAPLLRSADLWLRKHRPEIQVVQAEILSANDASRKAFISAGYELSYSVYEKELTC